MAIVKLRAKHSNAFAVVALIACNACLGEGSWITENVAANRRYTETCRTCMGSGMHDPTREVAYANLLSDNDLLKNQARARGRR